MDCSPRSHQNCNVEERRRVILRWAKWRCGPLFAFALVAAAILLPTTLCAAQPSQSPILPTTQTPSQNTTTDLNAILQQARYQLVRYTSLLPNVIGLEQGTSEEWIGQKLKSHVRFTAHIRMTHRPLPNPPNRITESLDFLTENGKPVHKTPKNIPLYLVDIFTNQDPSILPVSLHCVSYKRLPSQPGTILIERSIHPLKPADASFCSGSNLGETVQFTLDARSMQMIRLDRAVQPRIDLKKGQQIGFVYLYAPQRLGIGSEIDLLPQQVHAELVSADGKRRRIFDATYSDYQRYGSTATVLVPATP